jgi:uncharacterized tellurite resistance protein B-like protein
MLKSIQQFFESNIQPAARDSDDKSEHALQLATAALLIELTRADLKVEDRERRMVEDAIKKVFDLSSEETVELIGLAEEQTDKSTSLYEFTHLIDRGFPSEKKQQIVELLWRVALSDEHLEMHEEHLIRKVAKLLHVYHEEFIAAKIRAKQAMKGSSRRGDS